jgi:cellulose synthase/poly-beta-1,6-N-acetylglucosamine synthase-like glycosyltransferase
VISTAVIAAIFVTSLPLAVETGCLALELLAARAGRRQSSVAAPDKAVRCAVIIPAHDEEANLALTLRSVKAQLASVDRLIVVADNCSDNTAKVAAAEGAEVVERFDKTLIGKGYALDHGIRFLEADPPDVVLFFDADCVLGADCIARLVALCSASGRPVQGKNLCVGKGATPKERIREFAFLVKNYVRALGASRLGFPALLTGIGMAMPWAVIRSAKLASGHIAEDMKLGVDLSLAGHEPIYCPDASIESGFPDSTAGQKAQRTRWEHGHFTVIREYWPRLVGAAARQRRWSLLALACDIAVPPLGLLLIANTVVTAAAVAAALLLEASGWLVLPALLLPVFILALGITAAAHGRDLLRPGDLFAIPFYAFSKVPTLWSFLRKPQRLWIRSER